MSFRGQKVPILYSTGPKDIFLSKDWIAKGAIQRIGFTIFSLIFLAGSVALFVGSWLVRAQTAEMIGGAFGQVTGTVLAVLGLFFGCVAVFLAMKMLRGIVRSFHK
jgi:hypothetical protein